jgi:hypothetical protein
MSNETTCPPRPKMGDASVKAAARAALAQSVYEWQQKEPAHIGMFNPSELLEMLEMCGLRASDNAYKVAKKLESGLGYMPDLQLVQVCDDWEYNQYQCHYAQVCQWVKAYDVKVPYHANEQVRRKDFPDLPLLIVDSVRAADATVCVTADVRRVQVQRLNVEDLEAAPA